MRCIARFRKRTAQEHVDSVHQKYCSNAASRLGVSTVSVYCLPLGDRGGIPHSDRRVGCGDDLHVLPDKEISFVSSQRRHRGVDGDRGRYWETESGENSDAP
jgi:hypothetical protein